MSRMPTKKHLESDVKADMKKLLTEYGWYWFSPPANAYGKSGISDTLAVKDGMFMALEVKRGKSGLKATQPTANQIAFLQSIKSHRHFAFVVYEDRLLQLEAFLRSFNRAQSAAMRREKVEDTDGSIMINAIRELQLEI